MYLSAREPSEMLADEILQEVASILGKAIIRENERGLTGLVVGRKHSCTNGTGGKKR